VVLDVTAPEKEISGGWAALHHQAGLAQKRRDQLAMTRMIRMEGIADWRNPGAPSRVIRFERQS